MTAGVVGPEIGVAVDDIVDPLSYPAILAFALFSLGIGIAVGLLYRLVMEERTPWHVPVIVGVGLVGIWLNTASTMIQFVEQSAGQEPLLFQNMATNSVVVIASGLAAIVGARVGDQLAPNVRALSGATELEREVNQIVRTIGRFIAVKVPKAADIDDIEGYEPVPADTIASFAGAEFLFPRGLTVDELHDRVVDRLRSDHGVGHVDLELTDAGAIDYLAVGSRTAGIGPTLPLRHGAIGVQAVPAPDASPGDRVDLWAAADDGARRVAQGELRGTNGDVATVVTDVHRIASIDQSTTYDLVTRRSKQRPDLEFASLLRSANETMDAVTVGPGTPIVGIPVGALTLPVVAIRDAGGRLHPVPRRHYVCEDGDTLYVIGRHDELRKFRAAAGASAPVTTPGAAIDGAPAGDSVYSRLRTYSEKAIPSRFRREP